MELDEQRIYVGVGVDVRVQKKKGNLLLLHTPSPYQTVFTRLTTLDKMLLPVISG
jgi:hypothetical protein